MERIGAVHVLAIAAHPDDVEQTCGGTLLKMAERGYRTAILDLTAGEMGSRGTPEGRLQEAAEAARILRVSDRSNTRLPDARLENTLDARKRVAASIRAYRPSVVILPYWEARHPDHARCSEIGYEACFLAGLRKLDIGGDPHRPRKILYASLYTDVRPSFVVDISAQFERRMESLLSYRSQYADQSQSAGLFPGEADVAERLRAAARTYGALIDVEFGEPFVVKEAMRVDDIVGLGVRSV